MTVEMKKLEWKPKRVESGASVMLMESKEKSLSGQIKAEDCVLLIVEAGTERKSHAVAAPKRKLSAMV